MKLRYYAAIVTGSLDFMIVAIALWTFTKIDVIEIAFISSFAYLIGYISVIISTERRET